MSKSVSRNKNMKEIAAIIATAVAALVPLVINYIMSEMAKSKKSKVEQLKNKDRTLNGFGQPEQKK